MRERYEVFIPGLELKASAKNDKHRELMRRSERSSWYGSEPGYDKKKLNLIEKKIQICEFARSLHLYVRFFGICYDLHCQI